MNITAAMVKELREISGAGMMDCKKALTASDGDMDAAIEYLRKAGIATAAKKAGRIAAEGLVAVAVSEDQKTGAIVEVNSETDFVAKNAIFQEFVADVAHQALDTKATDMDGFMAEAWEKDPSITVKDALVAKVAVISENLQIRRFEQVKSNSYVGAYVHGGGRIAVLVNVNSEIVNDAVKEAAKNVAMQVAALNPRYNTRDDVPQEFLEHERAILMEQASKEGKPEAILKKMVEGRLNKELKEYCLQDQVYFRDDELTVGKYLKQVSKEVGCEVTVTGYVRYETGEGIEKKQEDFAAEVAKQMGQ
ncbi:MAG TPA: elongation factor Ts [Candidatus Faecimorpha stercoravium]|nr:elongation factor Ts [Candidatus Faecimorpha stercoravium]